MRNLVVALSAFEYPFKRATVGVFYCVESVIHIRKGKGFQDFLLCHLDVHVLGYIEELSELCLSFRAE
jgi:hypothetical protein